MLSAEDILESASRLANLNSESSTIHEGLGCSLENYPGLFHYPDDASDWSTTSHIQWANVCMSILTKTMCFLTFHERCHIYGVSFIDFFCLKMN